MKKKNHSIVEAILIIIMGACLIWLMWTTYNFYRIAHIPGMAVTALLIVIVLTLGILVVLNLLKSNRSPSFPTAKPAFEPEMISEQAIKLPSDHPTSESLQKRRQQRAETSKNKRSTPLLLGWISGLAYACYGIAALALPQLIAIVPTTGILLSRALRYPHILAVIIATVLTFYAWQKNRGLLAYIGAVVYLLAIVFIPSSFLVVSLPIVLALLGMIQIKRRSL